MNNIKKFFVDFLNRKLSKKGWALVRSHEMEYAHFKYNEAVNEIYSLVGSTIFSDIKLSKNPNRMFFLSRLYGTQLSEAMYILYYLQKAMRIDGDVCEFGCANGATSALLANEIKSSDKSLWLYDSFQGLSGPTKETS